MYCLAEVIRQSILTFATYFEMSKQNWIVGGLGGSGG